TMLRARARAACAFGQSLARGCRSLMVSQMARLSHTVSVLPFSEIRSAGTFPDGECGLIEDFVSCVRSGTITSSNATFPIFIASKGRRFKDDQFLLPI